MMLKVRVLSLRFLVPSQSDILYGFVEMFFFSSNVESFVLMFFERDH